MASLATPPKCLGTPKCYTEKVDTLHKEKWLMYNQYHWKHPKSEKTNIWGAIARTTEKEGKVNGVGMIPLIANGNQTDIILIAVYRPATDRFMIEFPGGLLDEGEFPL